jgi:poly-gamma-glutamate synthase PgsB/CapB
MIATPVANCVTIFLLVLIGSYGYTAWSIISYRKFLARLRSIEWRIHVNGIRGKSTVTRYLAAILREAGYHTFGKTTGSAARILQPNGQDADVGRKGFANVNEQVRMINEFGRQHAEAVVVECMAINPVYAKWLEDRVVKSHLGVITNVRYDHAEYMGETLEKIAGSLAHTIPRKGIVITAEREANLVKILAEEAKKKDTKLIVAENNLVSDDDLIGFSHFAIEANVAIGFCVADLIGLNRERALGAMQNAANDPGAFRIERLNHRDHEVVWANLFAVNDRESFINLCGILFKQYPTHKKVVVLNNRLDRPARVRLFTEISIDLGFDQIVTFGDYEAEVSAVAAKQHDIIQNLGNSTAYSEADGGALLDQILGPNSKSSNILLIGTVNIHTRQAENLMHFIEHELQEHAA